jgi:hypothetical protein
MLSLDEAVRVTIDVAQSSPFVQFDSILPAGFVRRGTFKAVNGVHNRRQALFPFRLRPAGPLALLIAPCMLPGMAGPAGSDLVARA